MSSTDPLKYGDAVPDQECWSRALTSNDYVTRDGTVHANALKGNGGLTESALTAWSHELSGRLTALAPNLSAYAEDRVEAVRQRFRNAGKDVPSKIKYMGIAFARAAEIRRILGLVADVLYTPNEDDVAHADIVIQHPADTDLNVSRVRIAARLNRVAPPQVDAAIATCGQVAAGARATD